MSSSKCYFTRKGTILNDSGRIPCGPPSSTGFVQCCGRVDTCGADGFCHYTRDLSGGSGYYLGGCTDATFKDPSCFMECFDQETADVVFSKSTGLWSCCYDNVKGLNCSSPTNTTFEAPDPEALFAVPFSSLTASMTESKTSSQGTTSSQSGTLGQSVTSATASSRPSTTIQMAGSSQIVTATVTATSSASSSSGLSTQAGAGIGVGIALAVIISFGALLVLRWRSRHRQQPIMQHNSKRNLAYGAKTRQIHEVDASERPVEISDGLRNPIELPNSTID